MASDRRDALLDGAVGYVLEAGIADLTLRPLAAALGTSDRMLIYHFGSRDALVTAVLGRIGDDLEQVVVEALPPGRTPPVALLGEVAGVVAQRSPDVDRRLRVWLEVAGQAAMGRQPHAEVAAAVVDRWTRVLADRLEVEGDPAAVASALLVVIDGALLLDALGHAPAAAAGAGWLLGRLGG